MHHLVKKNTKRSFLWCLLKNLQTKILSQLSSSSSNLTLYELKPNNKSVPVWAWPCLKGSKDFGTLELVSGSMCHTDHLQNSDPKENTTLTKSRIARCTNFRTAFFDKPVWKDRLTRAVKKFLSSRLIMKSRQLWNSHQRHKFLRVEAAGNILKFWVTEMAFLGFFKRHFSPWMPCCFVRIHKRLGTMPSKCPTCSKTSLGLHVSQI